MKVEKISETQIKFVLNQSDLMNRDIRLSELAYGSEKTQQLFREMMEQAMAECHFNADNTPLMIEAVPLSTDSIMIIVTKVAETRDDEKHLNLLKHMREAKRQMQQRSQPAIRLDRNMDSQLTIYSFGSLDEAASATARLFGSFTGTNALYKNNGRFYLIIHNDNPDDRLSTASIEIILNEYGQKHVSTPLSAVYLEEHGEIIIQDGAVDILNSVYA
ncbi:MAG: adaptor protein MecA [Clostridiales bacterium]|nr:adaptor protein MecA [Clostridiales bacterium]